MLTLGTPYWHRFVSVILAIAVGYAVIVAMIVVLFDKGTASLVGTFLAALLTTILGRLESHPVGESERSRSVALPTAPPTSGLWYFFTLTLAIFGLQVLMATVFGGVIVWWLSWSDVQIAVGEIPLRLVDTISSPFFLFGVVAANCLAYFFGGYLCGKTASNVRYGHAAFSSLCGGRYQFFAFHCSGPYLWRSHGRGIRPFPFCSLWSVRPSLRRDGIDGDMGGFEAVHVADFTNAGAQHYGQSAIVCTNHLSSTDLTLFTGRECSPVRCSRPTVSLIEGLLQGRLLLDGVGESSN